VKNININITAGGIIPPISMYNIAFVVGAIEKQPTPGMTSYKIGA
jgi:hypothetical protein